jgi:multidrug resistance efflux pump
VSRRNIILGGALILFAALVGALVMRALSGPPANRLLVAGDVRAVTRTVSAPAISYPNADYSVSVPSNASAGSKVAKIERVTPRQTGGRPSTGQPVVSGKLVRVNVRVGDHVDAGQVIAQLDTTLLDLGVKQAKINATKARISVRVLKNNLDTIADNQDKVEDGFDQLATGRSQLATGRSALIKARSQLQSAKEQLLELRRHRSQYKATLAGLKKQAAHLPPGHVPAKLKSAIAKLTMLLASITPGLAKVNAGLAQVNAGFDKLAAAQAKLASASAKLNDAGDALADAKKQVKRARDSLSIIADAQDLLIALAEAKRTQATIVAPVAGVVTQAAVPGTVVMVGTPIARIRPAEDALVDTYLTGAQLNSLPAGTIADITYDSASGASVTATMSAVGDRALFPPTSFPTDIVHMTRTVKVTFRLPAEDSPPPGTPVDIAIHTE